MWKTRLLLGLLATALVLPSATAFAQAPPAAAPDAIGLGQKPDMALLQKLMARRGTNISGVEISPDGTQIAYGTSGKSGARVEIIASNGKGEKHTLSAGPADKECSTSNPTWSPDSKSLAVVSDCATPANADAKDSQDEVFIIPIGSGGAVGPGKQLGALKGNVEDVAWSPDGKLVTFLYVANSTRASGATAAQRVPEGVIDQQMVTEVQRLAALDTAGSPVTFLTPDNLHIYEYDWSADSKSVIYTAAAPPGENNWWVAKLYTQAVVAGSQPTVVLDPATIAGSMHGMQMMMPRISPDGENIAFIGGLMSDFGSTGGDIYVVSTHGGDPKNLTEGRKASPNWIRWQTAGMLMVRELDQSDEVVSLLELPDSRQSFVPGQAVKTDKREPLFKAPESITLSVADNGDVAMLRRGFDRAPEIWAGKFTALEQITHLNTDAKAAYGKTESLTWENDGFRVQGWLTYPVDYDAHKKYPMIVSVHGGPAAAVTSTWNNGYASLFSNSGYFFFQPNPRGSYGQGEAFVQANRKDFGYGDLRDILAGMDKIVKELPVDPNRIGITGGSYGGFMSMFAPTQTQRFKASVAFAGISNWLSYYGENSIDQWMIPYFGASVYDDPAPYAKMSAINFVKNIKTPMLILVGDRDGECPAPQSFELWHALRDLNVPTELVIYPNEGHGVSTREHQLDVLAKTLEWFAKYMPAN